MDKWSHSLLAYDKKKSLIRKPKDHLDVELSRSTQWACNHYFILSPYFFFRCYFITTLNSFSVGSSSTLTGLLRSAKLCDWMINTNLKANQTYLQNIKQKKNITSELYAIVQPNACSNNFSVVKTFFLPNEKERMVTKYFILF